jgi:hypothetical protein
VTGIMGALVIASWSYGLIRDTGAILLDMNPDPHMTEQVRLAIEREGDKAVLADNMAETVVYRSSPTQPCRRCPDLVSANCTYSKLARVQSGKALTGKELK